MMLLAGGVDESQRRAATVVGFTYLFALVLANFSEFYVSGQLIVRGNAAETARNIVAHERLFRLGIASYLLCMATDVALIAALYVILERVSKPLALFAALMRIVETAIGVAATLSSFDVLRFLTGADYLQAINTDQLQALARASFGAYGAAINVSFVFFGLGSAMFCYLWFKSSYIPKTLAALGVFGSLLFGAGSFGVIVFPGLSNILTPTYFVPIFVFELTMGFWLLIKGL